MAKRKRRRHPSRRCLREVNRIARTRFSCPFGPANAYLGVFESAPKWEQIDLFARMLILHRNIHPNGRTDHQEAGDHETLRIYLHRYIVRVRRFRRQIQRGQWGLHQTASSLWRWLCTLPDRARCCAALTLVLEYLAPMADLRNDLLYMEDRDVLLRVRNTQTIRQSVAELGRLLQGGHDAVDVASVVLGLLDELPGDVARVTFLAETLAHITRPGQHRSTVMIVPLAKVGPPPVPPETSVRLLRTLQKALEPSTN